MAAKKPKRYTPEQREQILADKAGGMTLAQLSAKHGISSAGVYKLLARTQTRASTGPTVPELLEENRKLKEIIRTLLAL